MSRMKEEDLDMIGKSSVEVIRELSKRLLLTNEQGVKLMADCLDRQDKAIDYAVHYIAATDTHAHKTLFEVKTWLFNLGVDK